MEVVKGPCPTFEGALSLPHWRSSPGPVNAGAGSTNGNFMVAPLDVDGEPFPGVLKANSLALAVSWNLTATSVSQQLSSSMRIGIYTRNGSTLNLVNSALATFGNTNASNANTSRWNGVRMIQVVSSAWSKAPYFLPGQRYYMAIQFLSHITTGGMSLMNAQSFQTVYSGIQGATAPNATNMPFSPFRGVFTATTTAVPTTIQASQITGTGASMSNMPYFRIDADFSNY